MITQLFRWFKKIFTLIFWFLFKRSKWMDYYVRQKALKALEGIIYFDYQQKALGWNRHLRRQWWNAFIKSPEQRYIEVGSLIQQLSGKAFKFKLSDWLY